jgi:hypothetical protein
LSDQRFLGGLTAIAAIALGLRLHSWHLYADGWDSCEYTWAVQDHYLPHSPYLWFLWLGLALSRILPADIALSSLSLVSGVGAVILLGWCVWRQTGRAAAGWTAALGLAASPLCVWNSGIQEVYALQTALALGAGVALGGPGVGRAWWGGVLAGAALATHNATLLLAPAFLLLLALGRGEREDPRRRIGAVSVGASILPLATYGWSAMLFARVAGDGWGPAWLRYLRGLRPEIDPSTLTGSQLGASFVSMWDRIAESVVAGPPSIVGAVLAAALLVTAARRPRLALFWLTWMLPFALYETALGMNLDRGIYVMFVAPPLAALTGIAVGEIPRAQGPRRRQLLAGALVTLLVVTLLAQPLRRSVQQGRQVVSRAEFFQRPVVRKLRWLGENVSSEALLIQPSWVHNVNLGPAYSGLRPIFWRRGHFHAFEGGAWRPLNFSSYERLTEERVDELLAAGTEILALERHAWFTRSPSRTWLAQSMEIDGVRIPYYSLKRP